MPRRTCEGQTTACRSQPSLSTFMWGQEVKFRSSGLSVYMLEKNLKEIQRSCSYTKQFFKFLFHFILMSVYHNYN